MAKNYSFSTHLKAFGIGIALAVIGIVAYVQFAGSAEPTPDPDLPAITVYKSPTCGCCKEWVDHLQTEGFTVKTNDVMDMNQIKEQFGVPGSLSSCHTAVVEGYVVEGHVPAVDIKQLLQERPNVTGLTVPGMPVGSPGMEQGGRPDPYNVLAFNKQGQTSIFTKYRP